MRSRGLPASRWRGVSHNLKATLITIVRSVRITGPGYPSVCLPFALFTSLPPPIPAPLPSVRSRSRNIEKPSTTNTVSHDVASFSFLPSIIDFVREAVAPSLFVRIHKTWVKHALKLKASKWRRTGGKICPGSGLP